MVEVGDKLLIFACRCDEKEICLKATRANGLCYISIQKIIPAAALARLWISLPHYRIYKAWVRGFGSAAICLLATEIRQ